MESDLHRKIILNQDVVIQSCEQNAIKEFNKDEEIVILKLHNDIVTITPVMREVLDVARTPHTPEELMQRVAQTWGCSYESIYKPVWSFLTRMGKLGVLIYDVSASQQGESRSVLEELNQSMTFANFTLLGRLSKNYKVALYKCALETDASNYCALKVMLKRNPDESLLQRFFKEFEILKSIPPHRNIRNCFSASLNGGIPYLLLEYIDGISMSKKVKVSLNNKICIASQMIEAISHLHDHHILHGDIHASNFLVDNENNLHMIDLGMAYYDYEDEKHHHGGIPRYMPPERLPDHRIDFSDKKGDYRSEIFQLGVCLYFLLSGQFPFRGLLLKHLSDAIKYIDPLPLTTTPLGEPIANSIANVISKSMEKDPSNRYASVAEMKNAWELAIHHEELMLTT